MARATSDAAENLAAGDLLRKALSILAPLARPR
jgi:hypothetical protein